MAVSTFVQSRLAAHVVGVAAIAGSLVAISPAALAQSAGGQTPIAAASASVTDQAKRLLDAGQQVEAREMLLRAVRVTGPAALAPADKDAAFDLLQAVERQIHDANPNDITLQKAELAAAEGDLAQADRQVAALKGKTLSSAQQARVDALTHDVQARRDTLKPLLAPLMEQSAKDLAAGRYAEAKAAVLAVRRSGLELSADQRTQLDAVQLQILGVEQSTGKTIDASAGAASLGMFQPGVIRKTDADPAKPAQPPEPPAANPPAIPPAAPAGEQPATPPEQPKDAQPMPANPPATPDANTPQPAPAGQPGQPTPPAEPAQDPLIALALKAEAQKVLAQADQAYSEGRYGDAITGYRAATTTQRAYLSPDEIKHAEDRLSAAQARLGNGPIEHTLVDSYKLVRERTQAEYNNDMNQASAALAAGDISRARLLVATARSTATQNRAYFNQSENDAFMKKTEDLDRSITAAADKANIESHAKADALAIKKAEDASRAIRHEKDQKIYDLNKRAQALRDEQKYEEALQTVNEILEIDPNNPTAKLLHDTLLDTIHFRSELLMQKRRSNNNQAATSENDAAAIPPPGLMNYPDNWPAKSQLRIGSGGGIETPENSRTMALLDKKIPVNFQANRFSDVLAFVGRTTQTDIVPDWESLHQIGVDANTPVNLSLHDQPANVVLKQVLQQVSRDHANARADFAVSDGIVSVASSDAIRHHTTTQLFNITDLLLEIPDYTDVPKMDLAEIMNAQNNPNKAAKVDPFMQASDAKADARRTRQNRIRDIIDILEKTIDRESWADNGGDTGSIQELNGSLIITTTPRNHKEISGLLSKLREIRSLQINVETRFLLVDQNYFEQIGFDLDVIFNAKNNQVRAAQAVDPTILPSDFFNFAGNGASGTVGLQRDISGQVSQAGTSPPANAPQSIIRQGTVQPTQFSPIAAVGNSLGIVNSLVSSDAFASGLTAGAPALGIAGQFLDDVQVDFLLKATQADQRTVTLTAPRLTFTNGQTSNIYIVTEHSFVSDLTPVVGDSAVGFDPTVNVIPEGVVMQLEGVISSDRRYVTLNVDTSVTKLDSFQTATITAIAGGQLVNSQEVGSTIQLPLVTVTRVQTTVTVPDEGTVLLGGERIVNELEVEAGVPILSKLPIINRFFTNRVTSKSEQTLLILLKPTVMIQTEEEEKNFPGLSDSIRTGLGQ